MNDELIYRKEWMPIENESHENFAKRTMAQIAEFHAEMRARGKCYMVKFSDDDIRPMWENKTSKSELHRTVSRPNEGAWDCPLCQPYDPWDTVGARIIERRYMTKVVMPWYPNGCADEEGVWMKCPCIKRGERRKSTKFLP